eukprot:jgi/Hompol1/5526/HPOL_001292-RA
MLYVFLVDTSISMNRPFANGLTAMQAAQSGISHFFKWEVRKSERERRNTKYMLATYGTGNDCFKGINTTTKDAGGIERRAYTIEVEGKDVKQFLDRVRNLEAEDMSDAGAALQQMFDYLNVRRTKDKRDLPGVLHIPGLVMPGSTAYLEPFRWEQRLYTIALLPEGVPLHPDIATLTQNINGLASNMIGGQVWNISSVKALTTCMEKCLGANKAQMSNLDIPPAGPVSHIEGVAVTIESHPENTTRRSPEVMFVYANMESTNLYPIPEAYWPDHYSESDPTRIRFPPRNALPRIMINESNTHHFIFEKFPVDRFSIEKRNSEFVKELSLKPVGTCWTAIAKHSQFVAAITNHQLSDTSLSSATALQGTLKTTSLAKSIVDIPSNMFDIKVDQLAGILSGAQLKIKSDIISRGSKSSQSALGRHVMHSVPMSQMSDYLPRLRQTKTMRDPFEDEDQAYLRERNVFGSPYPKKGASKLKSMALSAADSDDEAAEEASQLGSGMLEASALLSPATSHNKYHRRRSLPLKYPDGYPVSKVPRLTCVARPCVLVPQFEFMTWESIMDDRLDCGKLLEDAQKGILVLTPTTDIATGVF